MLNPACTLKKIQAHEKSQTQKAAYCMIACIQMSPIGKSLGKKSKLLVARGRGRGKEEWGVTAEGSEASLQNDENILELCISDSHTTLKRYIL